MENGYCLLVMIMGYYFNFVLNNLNDLEFSVVNKIMNIKLYNIM